MSLIIANTPHMCGVLALIRLTCLLACLFAYLLALLLTYYLLLTYLLTYLRGDFDGAIDVYVEAGRVRVVRAEMEGVWRRMTDGSRRQVAPLVKVASEARLLKKLEADLRDDGWLS